MFNENRSFQHSEISSTLYSYNYKMNVYIAHQPATRESTSKAGLSKYYNLKTY